MAHTACFQLYRWRTAKLIRHDIDQKVIKWLEEEEKKPLEILSQEDRSLTSNTTSAIGQNDEEALNRRCTEFMKGKLHGKRTRKVSGSTEGNLILCNGRNVT